VNISPLLTSKLNRKNVNFRAQNAETPAVTSDVVKPQAPVGHLVKGSLLDAPAILAQDTAYDINSIKKGLKGDSNDHCLGKVNDMGMKAGGLAIASYLFTQKAIPATKAMEFIGFASFFGSMALWPKIAIAAPAYLLHGFNVQKRYVDSNGRKKPVFQDRQYLPLDLYTDKQINKIGDRMGVPKNIENRRNIIQDKMAQIATQNNTLWMLTAGFATPIMSALICNQSEKLVGAVQKKMSTKKAQNKFNDIENNLSVYLKNPKEHQVNAVQKNKAAFDNVLAKYANKTLTDGAYEEISNVMTPIDEMPTSFERQIKSLLESDALKTDNKPEAKTLTTDTFSELNSGMTEALKSNKNKGVAKYLESAVLSEQEMNEAFKDKIGKPIDTDIYNSLITMANDKAKSALQQDIKKYGENLDGAVTKAYTESPYIEKFFNRLVKLANGETLDAPADKIDKYIEKLLPAGNKETQGKWTKETIDGLFECINSAAVETDYLLVDAMEASVPSKKTLEKLSGEFIGKPVTKDVVENINKKVLPSMISSAKDVFEDPEIASQLAEDLDDRIYSVFGETINKITPRFNPNAAFEMKNVLDAKKIAKLREVNQTIADYNHEIKVLDDYKIAKVAATPDSVIANDCNEAKDKIFEALGFSKKDIKEARFDNITSSRVVRRNLEKIASDDATYKSTVQKLANIMNGFYEKYPENGKLVDGKLVQSEQQKFNQYADAVYNHFGQKFRSMGLSDLAESISGTDDFDEATAKYLKKLDFDERIFGIKGSFLNIIHNLDNYRRISNIEKLDKATPEERRQILEALGPNADSSVPTIERIESLSLAKDGISFHSSDEETKFFSRRQGTFDCSTNSYDDVKVKDGKILDETGKEFKPASDAVEMSYDTEFYKRNMDFMYNSGSSKDTEVALGKDLSKALDNYRAGIYNSFGMMPPETKEAFKILNNDVIYDIYNNRSAVLDNSCNSLESLKNILGYDVKSFKELSQKAGFAGINNVDDVKEIAKWLQGLDIKANDRGNFNYKIGKFPMKKLCSNSRSRFNNLGQTLDDFVNSIAKQKFNSGKWLKTFSTAGAVLLGVTVAAQFFFGKGSTENTNANKKLNKKG
jgi:hypothetical protein